MSFSNHYKDKLPELKSETKPRKTSPRKKTEAGEGNGFFARFREFWLDERTRNITGLTLLMLSAVMLISMTSYLFYWQNDYEIDGRGFWSLLTKPDPDIQNWLGNFGAAISHALITKGFGIASFAFVLITFLIGFRALFGIHLLPFWKTTAYALFALTWLSLCLGTVLGNISPNFGGVFGYYGSLWLQGSFGLIGAYGILIFSALVFSIFNFNLRLSSMRHLFIRLEPTPEVEPLEDQPAKEISFDEPEPEALPIIPEPIPATMTDEELPIDLSPAAHVESEILDGGSTSDLNFEIETPEEEVMVDAGEETTVEGLEDYDPMLDLSRYQFPPIDMLRDHGDGSIQVERDELERNKNRIVDTLRNYNIGIAKITATIGPTVTLYEIVPEAGVRISKIKNLEDDIALSLAALGIRIIAPIPGKGTIGIEVPNQNPDVVSMRTVIQSEKFQSSKMDLPVALGKTISNETFITDLTKMPHLLMAGATGQGKSVGLNCILASLLYKKHPAQVKFVLVDPKKVELTLFNKIERHFLAKLPGEEEAIITDTSKVVNTLNSLCIEMDDRYELLKNAQCRNLKEYNAKFIKRKLNPNNGHRYLPYIVLVVDEFADLIMTAGKEVELPIARLAQLARAIGIHLIIATQRPSVNIITGTIKANFPTRIAFRVTSKIDSRTILDSGGAEQLIGRGDMLFSNGNDLIRLQCAFVDTPEIEDIVNFIGEQQGYPDAHLLPEYAPEGSDGPDDFDSMDRDAMFADAARVVVMNQQGSASLLQRKLKLGYNRAGRIVDQLEAAGIIGPFEGSKARQVLIGDEVSLERHLKALDDKKEQS